MGASDEIILSVLLADEKVSGSTVYAFYFVRKYGIHGMGLFIQRYAEYAIFAKIDVSIADAAIFLPEIAVGLIEKGEIHMCFKLGIFFLLPSQEYSKAVEQEKKEKESRYQRERKCWDNIQIFQDEIGGNNK